MTHRIDLDELLDQYVSDMTARERDHFESALYCWRDEAVTDAMRSPDLGELSA